MPQLITLIRHDLQFILDQIILADNGGVPLNNFLPFGLRQVDGSGNNLLPGQDGFGAADRPFGRLLDQVFRPAGDNPFIPGVQLTSYTQTSGTVFDPNLRLISNLIVDASPNNPAAIAAAAARDGSEIITSPGLDGIFGTADDTDVFFIPNIAPDGGLSAPFNAMFTFFGQFFDHGLDLINKGGQGSVLVPLAPDDPLYDFGADGIVNADDGFGPDGLTGGANSADDRPNFMALTRATIIATQPGLDGLFGTSDDVRDYNNQTTPWVDQNQTYTSHPTHQAFLREYAIDGAGNAVSTGRLLDGAVNGGLATWAEVKAQANTILGIALTDADLQNMPMLRTDEYGKLILSAAGTAQLIVGVGTDGIANTADDDVIIGDRGAPVSTATALRINHAFLDDIAHAAVPVFFAGLGADGIARTADDLNIAAYDEGLLNEHFATGDGRGNENIGLTTVHHIFHSEHNRLVDSIKQGILDTGDPAFIQQWLVLGANQGDGIQDLEWNGERIFQAARFATEMQYQHLVFEEFARKLHPQVNVFAGYNATVNPAIFSEFANVVYRLGHSMLTETIDRFDPDFSLVNSDNGALDDDQQIGLIAAFLNPLEFSASGAGNDADLDAGAIVRGMTRQVGNQIDEFVTDALRNSLVGLPLDLAVLNLARGRDTGVPSLNAARRDFFANTGDSQLRPYTSWVDFAQHVKHPASVVNFIAAYGTHALITAETSVEGRRAAALAIVTGASQTVTDMNGTADTGDDTTRTIVAPTDRLDFLNSTGAWANLAGGVTISGLDDVDMWIGGLAEEQMPFGGMLGSTFAFIFEMQMEMLQDHDRFYYLLRTVGLNFLTELEGNSFAALVMRNTDATHLPADIFSTPTWILEVDQATQFNPDVLAGPDGILGDDITTPLVDESADDGALVSSDPINPLSDNPFGGVIPLVIRDNPNTVGPDTNYLQYTGEDHVVLGGTAGNDILIANEGDDTVWGDGGDDRIEGGNGADILNGGDGDDIISDLAFDDNIKGNEGNDAIQAGDGFDLVLGGGGQDFLDGGRDINEEFGGRDSDFIQGGDATDTIFGGEGDDWLEGGGQADLIQGDNGDPFQVSSVTGDDVLFGGGGDDDYDSESGDDIMMGDPGTERNEGMLGFDWVSYARDTAGIVADMNVRVFAPPPLPGSPNAFLDRFDLVEGLSGTAFSDVLIGDSGDAGIMVGHELTQHTLDLIDGLQELVGAGVTFFTGGNIIIGGDGSDNIQGMGGNDLIDGDASLDVFLSIRDPNDASVELFRAQNMGEIYDRIFSDASDPNHINPGDIQIGREITWADGFDDIDTAVFTDIRANYTIEGDGLDLDGDGFITVSHNSAVLGVGLGADGVDRVRNIERLQFSDEIVVLSGVNSAPVGFVSVTGTFTEDQPLTASIAGVTDADNPGGTITGPVSYVWQVELDPVGAPGVFTDILLDILGEIVPAQGPTFIPGDAEVGLRLRVRATYQDATGVIETVYSEVNAATPAIANVNDQPTGQIAVSDSTPTEGSLLTAQHAFIDVDGLAGATFVYQWQSSNDGTNWTDIAGANTQLFQPGVAQRGLMLRVFVTYTDDGGTVQTGDSTPAVGEVFSPALVSAATGRTGSLVSGTVGPNILTGSAFDDTMLGLLGADVLNGLAGADNMNGGGGGDTLNGGDGNDLLTGEAGIDTLNGDNNDDTLVGGAGNDNVNGGAGNDTMVYALGDGADAMNGGLGTDTLNVTGTIGADVLDVVLGSTGGSLTSLEGGTLTSVERVNANLGAGDDALSYAATVAAVSVAVNLGAGTASGFVGLSGIENAAGGAGNDNLTGSGGANVLTGNQGNDNVNGGAGNDSFVASLLDGNDAYVGGLGTDIYVLSGTTASAVVNLALGTATSAQTGTDTLSGVEGVVGSFGIDTLTGDGGANMLDGGNGGDTLNGGGGNDTLIGGAGGDTINGDAGDDLIVYTFGDGTDVIYDGGANTDTVRVNGTAATNNLTVIYNGSTITSFQGIALVNVEALSADLAGGNDRLSYAGTLAAFGVSVDLLAGTASGFSTLANIENVTGGSGNDTILGNDGDNDLNGGANGGADTLNGRGGVDNLVGGAGNDILIGGAGNDTMNGGANADTFAFSAGFGADTITGFDANPVGGQDLLDISALGITAATFAANVSIAQVGGTVVVTIGGDTITLLATTLANVTIADFLLAP